MSRNITRNSWIVAALAVTLGAAPARAQDLTDGPDSVSRTGSPMVRELRAIRVDGARPVIDGRLDEEIWASAHVATDFVQFEPESGAPATRRTEVRILYDADAIYVAARMHDDPDSITAQLVRRDDSGHSDWFHVAIDSYFDRRTAFAFALNPYGVQQDLMVFDDTRDDVGWDAVWEGAARMDSAGWTAEFRIPLSQLRFDSSEEARDLTWGINFRRYNARNREVSFWAPTPRDANRLVSLFGHLRGLEGIRPSRNLEVRPYGVARLDRAPVPAGDPFRSPSEGALEAGLDLRYGLTSDMTVSATFNPDFGQVEADPSVVNLTAFETFLPEKRPFFLEGADIFRFGIGVGDGDLGNESLFYSRRIGRAPQLGAPGEAHHSDVPESTRILGAAKLSGKTRTGWSVGLLQAVTAPATARWIDGDGIEGDHVVEPLTNYAVARAIKDFREGQSAVGGILTATNRRLDEPHLERLRTAAYSGGVNARHRLAGGDVQISGYLLGSHVRGSETAITATQRSSTHYFQRPDADHLHFDPERTSMSGWAGNLQLMKMGGGHWRYGGILVARSPGFQTNDLGFQGTSDQVFAVGFLGYEQFRPGPVFRRWFVGTNHWHVSTFGGERLALGGNVNGNAQLDSYWGFSGGLNWELPTLSTSALRGGPALRGPAGLNGWANANTDSRRPLRLQVSLSGNREMESGARRLSVAPQLSLRPSSRLDLSVRPSMTWNEGATQYVTGRAVEDSTRYVFAALDQTTFSLTTRVSYAFSPALSLQFYAQPFVSAGDYGGYRLVADPRGRRHANRFAPLEPGSDLMEERLDDGSRRFAVDVTGDGEADFAFSDPSFNVRQLRSNAVLRWEWRPGSTLYLVWSHGRAAFDRNAEFALGRDLSDLLSTPARNVFVVKGSYWLGL